MRIAISGPGASGKTTVMEMVAAAINIQPLHSVVRGVFARHGLNEKDQLNMLPGEAWELQREIFEARIAAEHAVTGFISDRTLVDHMAYCLFRASGAIPDEAYRAYSEIMKESLRTYDAIFYLPMVPEIQTKDDKFRQVGLAYEEAMDLLIHGLYSNHGYRPFVVEARSPEGRTREIISTIRRLTQKTPPSKTPPA